VAQGGVVAVFEAAGFCAGGVDPDGTSISMGLNAKTVTGAKLNIQQIISNDIPFKDGEFDIVLSKSALEHVEDKKKYVSEAIRVLKPGGIFYIAYNCNRYFYLEHHSLLPIYKCINGRESAILKSFGFQPYWKITPQNYFEFRELLEDTGLKFKIIPGRTVISSSLLGRVLNKVISVALDVIMIRKFVCSGWVAVVYKD